MKTTTRPEITWPRACSTLVTSRRMHEHSEELKRRNTMFPGTLFGIGKPLRETWESSKRPSMSSKISYKDTLKRAGYVNMGEHLISVGKDRRGARALRRRSAPPGNFDAASLPLHFFVLDDDWAQADAIGSTASQRPRIPTGNSVPCVIQTVSCIRGNHKRALDLLDPDIASFPPGRLRAVLHYLAGVTHFARGEAGTGDGEDSNSRARRNEFFFSRA